MFRFPKLQLPLLFLTISLLNLAQAQEEKRQPDQVIEIFRHGARAPLTTFDPQWSDSQLGELTVVGMLQHYELGKSLAEKYPNLVASGYDPNDVFVLSCSRKRCIESAMVHLSSMFRGKTSTLKESPQKELQEGLIAKYSHHLLADEADRGDYVPIEVEVVKFGSEEELILKGRNPRWCSNIEKYRKENTKKYEMSHGWEAFQDTVKKVNKYLDADQKITELKMTRTAYDAFEADMNSGKVLPGRMTDVHLIESLNFAQSYFLYVNEELQSIQRELASFNMLRAIMNQMENFRIGNNSKKLALYSGNDKNIFALLSSFGVINDKCLLVNYEDHVHEQNLSYPNCRNAGFASNLVFEFYNDTKNPYVKVLYDDVLVTLCNGKETCSYGEFKSLVRNANPEIQSLNGWNKQCGGNSLKESHWRIIVAITCGGLILIIITAWIFIKKNLWEKFKNKHTRHVGIVEEDSTLNSNRQRIRSRKTLYSS